MKDLQTGETSGEPLDHDEWLKEQAEAQAEEARQQEARSSRRSAKNTAARQAAPASLPPARANAPVNAPAAPDAAQQPEDLESLTVADLRERAKTAEIHGAHDMTKAELIKALNKAG